MASRPVTEVVDLVNHIVSHYETGAPLDPQTLDLYGCTPEEFAVPVHQRLATINAALDKVHRRDGAMATDVSTDESDASEPHTRSDSELHRQFRSKYKSSHDGRKVTKSPHRDMERRFYDRQQVRAIELSDQDTIARKPSIKKFRPKSKSGQNHRELTKAQKRRMKRNFYLRQRLLSGRSLDDSDSAEDHSDDDLSDVQLPPGMTLQEGDFILKRQDVDEFADMLLEAAQRCGERPVLRIQRLAFAKHRQTAGSRWFHHFPRLRRSELLTSVQQLARWICDPDLGSSYTSWCTRHEFTDADFDDDAVAPPEFEAQPPAEEWATLSGDLTKLADPPADEKHAILSCLVDTTVSDAGLTQQEKDDWFQRAADRLPKRAYGKPSFYGTAPAKVPKVKTADNPTGSYAIAKLGTAATSAIDVSKIAAESTADDTMKKTTNALGRQVYAGTSYPYGCVILHGNQLATFYRDWTVCKVGNDPEAVLTTVLRFHSKAHAIPQIEVEHLVLLRDTQIPFLTVTIPFTALTKAPEVVMVEAPDIRNRMRPLGFNHKQSKGASRLCFTAKSTQIQIRHDRLAQKDLIRAGFPEFMHIVQHIVDQHQPTQVPYEAYIPSAWKDFGFWASIFGDLYSNAVEDPLAEIRLGLHSSQVVDLGNVNLKLTETTERLPALRAFNSVEDQVTILSDGVVREAYFQQTQAEALAELPMKVIVQPVGSVMTNVPKPGRNSGLETIAIHQTYVVSVVACNDPKRLAELAPPPGNAISCQLAIPSAATDQPLVERTNDEKCEMIGSQLCHAMKQAEGRPYAKFVADPTMNPEDAKAARDAYNEKKRLFNMAVQIAPFVRPVQIPEGTNADEALLSEERMWIALATEFRRNSEVGPDGKRIREKDSEWRARVIRACARHLNVLTLPPFMRTTAPRWIGIRYDPDGPLRRLSDVHFLVKLPTEPGWDRKNGRAPFICPRFPKLPVHTGDADQYINELIKVKSRCAVDASFEFNVDDRTTTERIKGLKKLQDRKGLTSYQWMATLQGEPGRADLFAMVPLLDRIRYHVVEQMSNPEQRDLDELVPDDHLQYPQEETDSTGKVNPITTREFQVQQNKALKRYVRMVLNYDRDQLQAFFNLDKAPFGCLYVEGCAGSGKTSLTNFVASVLQDSELIPVADIPYYMTYQPDEVESPIAEVRARNVQFQDEQEFGDDITWIMPQLREQQGDAPTIPDDHSDDSSEAGESPAPVPVSDSEFPPFPELLGGPSSDEVQTFAADARKLATNDQLDHLLKQIQLAYRRNLRATIDHWIKTEFRPAFVKEFANISRDQRLELYPQLLDDNASRYWHRGTKHFTQWKAAVQAAMAEVTATGSHEEIGACVDNYRAPTPTIQSPAIPAPDPTPTPELPPAAQPSGDEPTDAWGESTGTWGDSADTWDNAVTSAWNDEPLTAEEAQQFTSEDTSENKAPWMEVGGKLLMVVQRNEHGERLALNYLEMTRRSNPDRNRTVIKVNNVILEQAELVRTMRGIDPRLYMDKTTLSVAEQLSLELSVEDVDDFAVNQGAYSRNLSGGVFTLNAAVIAMIKAGKADRLHQLLQAEARPDAVQDKDRVKEIAKRLKDLYKRILSTADAVVCTPTVASQLADKDLFKPTITIFDEAGMMPEADSILVMQQHSQCRHFIFAGDHYQGGILAMADNHREIKDSVLTLFAKPRDDRPQLTTAIYRREHETAGFVSPFTWQYQMSMLKRIDTSHLPNGIANRLMVNHRQEGGLERIVSGFAYNGRMESAFNANDLSPPAAALQEFLNKDVLRKKPYDTETHLNGTRATIFMAGNPVQQGTSWENNAQCQLALHLAATMHQRGFADEKGNLVSILISTPYAQATRSAIRLLKRMSPWEICKSRVDVRTIDNSQGSEYDVTITPFIHEKGGFLWKAERPLVAWTRARYAAIDIMSENITKRVGPKWAHFRIYDANQRKFNGTVVDKRDWTTLSNVTFQPTSTKIPATEIFCPRCARFGHHPRNCIQARVKDTGLHPIATRNPQPSDAASEPIDLGHKIKEEHKFATEDTMADRRAQMEERFAEEDVEYVKDQGREFLDKVLESVPAEEVHEYQGQVTEETEDQGMAEMDAEDADAEEESEDDEDDGLEYSLGRRRKTHRKSRGGKIDVAKQIANKSSALQWRNEWPVASTADNPPAQDDQLEDSEQAAAPPDSDSDSGSYTSEEQDAAGTIQELPADSDLANAPGHDSEWAQDSAQDWAPAHDWTQDSASPAQWAQHSVPTTGVEQVAPHCEDESNYSSFVNAQLDAEEDNGNSSSQSKTVQHEDHEQDEGCEQDEEIEAEYDEDAFAQARNWFAQSRPLTTVSESAIEVFEAEPQSETAVSESTDTTVEPTLTITSEAATTTTSEPQPTAAIPQATVLTAQETGNSGSLRRKLKKTFLGKKDQ